MDNLRTTEEWWAEVSNDPDKMVSWLKDQYHGEITAASRIEGLLKTHAVTNRFAIHLINRIVKDELKHAAWISRLLVDRGIIPEVLNKESRYWAETMPKYLEINTFSYACAVAHLAEEMRLERITLLSGDSNHSDIAAVFMRIEPDEEFHTIAFATLSTEKDIEIARKYHKNGMNALGLIA